MNSGVLASYTPWLQFCIILLLSFRMMRFNAVISELDFQFIPERKALV